LSKLRSHFFIIQKKPRVDVVHVGYPRLTLAANTTERYSDYRMLFDKPQRSSDPDIADRRVGPAKVYSFETELVRAHGDTKMSQYRE
jgi:hypothetical protein